LEQNPSISRRAGNTLALEELPGGFLKLTGANSGAGLRSDPPRRARIVLYLREFSGLGPLCLAQIERRAGNIWEQAEQNAVWND
jgi:hypothetical protein